MAGAQYEFGDEVELFDLGTPTLDFVDNLRGREVLVLIDALASGVRTGRASSSPSIRSKFSNSSQPAPECAPAVFV